MATVRRPWRDGGHFLSAAAAGQGHDGHAGILDRHQLEDEQDAGRGAGLRRRAGRADAARDPRIQRFVIPPFTAVREVKAMLAATSVKVGAQNMHWADDGAWTGEISPVMLKDCNLDIVELGHSRTARAFRRDRRDGRPEDRGRRPPWADPADLHRRNAGRARGRPCRRGAGDARCAGALGRLAAWQKRPRSCLPTSRSGRSASTAFRPQPTMPMRVRPRSSMWREACSAAACLCLYGGSVNPGNCAELIACPHIDGLFIGRSAWDVDGLSRHHCTMLGRARR